jgi:Spx/MgsR family transcriptional regulator
VPTAKKSNPAKKPARKFAGSAKKAAKTAQFLQFATCPTCRKARSFMKKRGFKLNVRDLQRDQLSAVELEKLIGTRDHEDFLNPRSKTFQKQEMDENPPSRRTAISWMAKDPGLISRPIVLAGGRVVVGFDQNGMARLCKRLIAKEIELNEQLNRLDRTSVAKP